MGCGVYFRKMMFCEMKGDQPRMSETRPCGTYGGRIRTETDPGVIAWGYRSLCNRTLQIRP